MLKQFANILDKHTSKDISVARIGGDEFALLLKGKSPEFTEEIYDNLLESIKVYNFENKDMPIKVAIGLGYSKTSIGMIKQLYNIADSRMYEDKAANKKYRDHPF